MQKLRQDNIINSFTVLFVTADVQPIHKIGTADNLSRHISGGDNSQSGFHKHIQTFY